MLPEKPITRREMYLDYIARNGAIGGGITIDEEPTQGSYHATGSGGLYDALESLREDINALRVEVDSKVYGVAGVGQEASALTRTHDAVGMVAQVGTDGDNSGVRNDFDTAGPWMRRKCVGRWVDGGDRARFVVSAYLGDPWYTEDGSIGDYVAVECPRCYYRFDHETGALAITAIPMRGYRAFDIFCHNHNQAETMDVFYAPAYALAVKDGKAVSLPGLDNDMNMYKGLVDTARTYGGGTLGGDAVLMPIAFNFYEWALFTVEFATQHCQSVMRGATELRSVNSDACSFVDNTHVLINNYYAGRVAGEYIAIVTTVTHTDPEYKATHKIKNIIRCDSTGTASDNGDHQLIEVEDLGRGYFTYNTGVTYYLGGRPYRTGECNDISTPSGSLVNNNNGYYPCRYRWRENPYGNQFTTTSDLFSVRKESNGNVTLEYYYLISPESYFPEANNKPEETDLEGNELFEMVGVLAAGKYADGYIKSRMYSKKYPDVWMPDATGATFSTYFSDYTYRANNAMVIRSVRLGGTWYTALSSGFSYEHEQLPSSGWAYFGGNLFFAQ